MSFFNLCPLLKFQLDLPPRFPPQQVVVFQSVLAKKDFPVSALTDDELRRLFAEKHPLDDSFYHRRLELCFRPSPCQGCNRIHLCRYEAVGGLRWIAFLGAGANLADCLSVKERKRVLPGGAKSETNGALTDKQ